MWQGVKKLVAFYKTPYFFCNVAFYIWHIATKATHFVCQESVVILSNPLHTKCILQQMSLRFVVWYSESDTKHKCHSLKRTLNFPMWYGHLNCTRLVSHKKVTPSEVDTLPTCFLNKITNESKLCYFTCSFHCIHFLQAFSREEILHKESHENGMIWLRTRAFKLLQECLTNCFLTSLSLPYFLAYFRLAVQEAIH